MLATGLLSQRPLQVRRNRRKDFPSSPLGDLVAEASLPGVTRLAPGRPLSTRRRPCRPSMASIGGQSLVSLGTIRRHLIQAVDRVMLIVSDAAGQEFRFWKKSRRTARNVNKNGRLACRLSEGRQSSIMLEASCQSRDADCDGCSRTEIPTSTQTTTMASEREQNKDVSGSITGGHNFLLTNSPCQQVVSHAHPESMGLLQTPAAGERKTECSGCRRFLSPESRLAPGPALPLLSLIYKGQQQCSAYCNHALLHVALRQSRS